MSVQICMSFILLLNTKYILKNVNNQTVSVPTDFPTIFVNTMEVNENRNGLITNILQNIFFCAPQKKEIRFEAIWMSK